MTFRLADPIWLAALAGIAAVLVFAARRGRGALGYSSVALLAGAPRTFAQRIARLLPAARFVGLGLVVFALARPQRGIEEYRVRTEGIAIMMAIDRSGSMRALDFEVDGERVNRLEVVKQVFRDFVEGQRGEDDATSGVELEGRPNDLIGLVSFGGYPEERCPLTLDHGALLLTLEGVVIPEPVLGADGQPVNLALYQESLETAIGDAIAMGVERLKDAKAKSKVLILLSDGDQTAGVLEPIPAAEAAKELGVKIHTIGVGTDGVVPFPAVDRFGNEGMVARRVSMDEETLKEIAAKTGGRYWNAQDTATLAQVYADIDQLERTEVEGTVYTDYQELFRLALFPAVALLLLDALLAATRLRTLP